MPVAVATGRALKHMRLDAGPDPPLPDESVVMGGVRLTDPLEQEPLDSSRIEQVSVADLQARTSAVFRQPDRLDRQTDKLYPKASAIGFATIPSPDEDGLAIAAVNRMIAGAVRGVIARERPR